MWHPGGLSAHFLNGGMKEGKGRCCVLVLPVGKENRVSFSFFCCKDKTKGFLLLQEREKEGLCHLRPKHLR